MVNILKQTIKKKSKKKSSIQKKKKNIINKYKKGGKGDKGDIEEIEEAHRESNKIESDDSKAQYKGVVDGCSSPLGLKGWRSCVYREGLDEEGCEKGDYVLVSFDNLPLSSAKSFYYFSTVFNDCKEFINNKKKLKDTMKKSALLAVAAGGGNGKKKKTQKKTEYDGINTTREISCVRKGILGQISDVEYETKKGEELQDVKRVKVKYFATKVFDDKCQIQTQWLEEGWLSPEHVYKYTNFGGIDLSF